MRAIGERQARRYFVTAERFDARTARRLGLVHEAVPEAELDTRLQSLLDTMADNGPMAMAEAKDLARMVARTPFDDRQVEATVQRIAALRASAEGREGIGAFLDKRPPDWTVKS